MLTRRNRRTYRIHNVDQKQEWAAALIYHIPVVVGVALTAAGSSKLQHHEQPIEKAETLIRAGMAILTACWVLLAAWTALAFRAPKAKNADRVNAGNVVWFLHFPLPVKIPTNHF